MFLVVGEFKHHGQDEQQFCGDVHGGVGRGVFLVWIFVVHHATSTFVRDIEIHDCYSYHSPNL